MKLESTAFGHFEEIPARYTCEGADVSPPLGWTRGPEGTESYALIVDDPDAPDPRAPKMTFVHWVVFDIPASVTSLPENAREAGLPSGIRMGRNDWYAAAWGGPCPPIGRHRYFFKLYALDTKLSSLVAPTKAELEHAMEGHILEKAELTGTFIKESQRAQEVVHPEMPVG